MSHGIDDYALVIGINAYPEWNKGARTLRGAEADAKGFQKWLVKDTGGGLSPKNVKLILSSVNPTSPRQFKIDDAFREIREQSKDKTRRRFYFYFSGHGHSRAGSWQQQSLCLANWSPDDPGAALHLESYIKASVGCLKFSESVFFIDCCRVRNIVPLGHPSELECGDPDTRERHFATLYGSDHYEPTYEGEVQGEIRGYFTAGLLKVLNQGYIEFSELLRILKVIVPESAKPKDQTVRATPPDKNIFFGLPDSPPPLASHTSTNGTHVTISVTSNLTAGNFTGDHEGPPRVGDISILRDDCLVVRGLRQVETTLLPGRYQVRIDHAESSATHDIDVANQPVEYAFDLPRRASATLLSSTIGKHEWLTEPVMQASRWDALEGEQAAFISLRSKHQQPGESPRITGLLFLESEQRPLVEGNSLHKLPPGIKELSYYAPDGTVAVLPFPIAAGWDTHIFILTSEGKPQLATASVSMRPAGAGFDPSDALIDAYERAIADLMTGGPGPDPATMNLLLYGKYRNPLFGVLGALFLIRKLRRDAVADKNDLDLLSLVTANLGKLLGQAAPDVVALRLWKQLITKTKPTEHFGGNLPLFNVGFQAFIEATAVSDSAPDRQIDKVALGLDLNSPWTHWKSEKSMHRSSATPNFLAPTTFIIESDSFARIKVVEKMLREEGFSVEVSEQGTLRVERPGSTSLHLTDQIDAILSMPNRVVNYMRDAMAESARREKRLDLSRLVHLTMFPLNVLRTAQKIVELLAAEPEQQEALQLNAEEIFATATEEREVGGSEEAESEKDDQPGTVEIPRTRQH